MLTSIRRDDMATAPDMITADILQSAEFMFCYYVAFSRRSADTGHQC